MDQEELYNLAGRAIENYANTRIAQFCLEATRGQTVGELVECTNRSRRLNSDYFVKLMTHQKEAEEKQAEK